MESHKRQKEGAIKSDRQRLIYSLECWEINTLPALEHGIIKAGADPIELVMAFEPWLNDIKKMMSQELLSLSYEEYKTLKHLLERAIDGIEILFSVSGQLPATGLAYLEGLDDLLCGLSICSHFENSVSVH